MAKKNTFDPNEMMNLEQEEADKSYDGYVLAMFDSNSGDGAGWHLDHMPYFHKNTTVQVGESYYTRPSSISMPLSPHHPLKVIAKLFHDAQNGSAVQVFAFMLTDMDAIDLLAHHAKSKTVNVVIHPSKQTYNRLAQFFDEFGNSARRHFANVRVAPMAEAGCTHFTQMHVKGVITESLSAFGSYNLTYTAKHASWEMITVKTTTAKDIDFFDELWATCSPIQHTRPELLSLKESPLGKRSNSEI